MKTTELKTTLGLVGKLLQNAPAAAAALLGTLPGGILGLAITVGAPLLGKALQSITADSVSAEDLATALAGMRREEPFDLQALLG